MTPKQILVIDDEPRIQEAIRITLEMMMGWEITTARSGTEGITLALSQPPDAILLDLMMPELDGRATFAQLQSDPQTQALPVILLTAKLHPDERQHFLQLGFRAVIAKPFEPLTLAHQIAQALDWPLDPSI